MGIDEMIVLMKEIANKSSSPGAMQDWKDAAAIVCSLQKPHDNGDGTVTLHGVPVTVPKAWLDGGREVEAVRVENVLGVERVRIIASDPKPQFAAGQWYKNKRGEAVRIITGYEGDAYLASDGRTLMRVTESDLQPGALTVWQPPKSLKKGKYYIDASGMTVVATTEFLSQKFLRVCYCDWIDPPKFGRYTIATDGGIAVWEGEA